MRLWEIRRWRDFNYALRIQVRGEESKKWYVTGREKWGEKLRK